MNTINKILNPTIKNSILFFCPEIISEFSLALERKVRLDELSAAIHVYPSYSIGVMQAAAAFRINQFLKGFSGKIILSVSRFFR